MNVLSLFDGISCGRVALERAKIKVDRYYASEIDKNAIKITQHNHPDTIQLGDIRKIDGKQLPNIDLFWGGSPCQNFSIAGKMNGASTKNQIEITSFNQYQELKKDGCEFDGQSFLFWEYIRLLKEINPKYFLLENVKMTKKWERVITETLGIDPIEINSGLVSAQDRKRLYWTNIPNVIQPKDKNISIDDILQKGIEHEWLPNNRLDYNNYDKSKVDKSIYKNTPTQLGNSRQFGNSVKNSNKSYTLRRTNPNGIIDENWRIRYFTPIEAERLQTLPDNYTLVDGVSKRQRLQGIGNGWTVDVIAHILSFLPEEYKIKE